MNEIINENATDTKTETSTNLSEPYRNSLGYVTHVTHIYNPEGDVNWKKMLKPEHIAPNKEKTKETDISKLEDKDLIILLGGLKYLAKLRGYYSIDYQVVYTSADQMFVSVKCNIRWRPNYETDFVDVSTSALADASAYNTSGFSSKFLTAIAQNRAFSRCVREFLNVNIVSEEEIDSTEQNVKTNQDPSVVSAVDTYGVLETAMNEKGITFEFIKNKLIKKKVESAETFQSVRDIPSKFVFEFIEKVKKYKSKKDITITET